MRQEIIKKKRSGLAHSKTRVTFVVQVALIDDYLILTKLHISQTLVATAFLLSLSKPFTFLNLVLLNLDNL